MQREDHATSRPEGEHPGSPGAETRMAPSPRREIVLEKAELYIYVTTAFILVLAAAGLLVVAVLEMVETIMTGDYIGALVPLLDRALLVLMLAEIIYTVRRIAYRKRLEAGPFFIVGLIAAIRRILVITAESTRQADLHDPVFQAAMLELGLLALIIIAIAGAMRLIPAQMAGRD